MPTIREDKVPLKIFDEYCKSVTIPDLSIDVIESVNFMGVVSKESFSGYNETTNVFVVEFICSEGLDNYYYFYDWYIQLRSGETATNSVKNTVIKTISVHLMDNQDRVVSILNFEDCLPNLITNLSLVNGETNEVTFSVNFNYARMTLDREVD